MHVFISYRRGVTTDIVGRIRDRLSRTYGVAGVFRDMDSIPPGVAFPGQIEEALAKARVVLAIIGNDWATGDWNAPQDWLRMELETALRQKGAIIPVLVGEAQLPTAETLPKSLRPLLMLQAIRIHSDSDFEPDITRLIDAINVRGTWWRRNRASVFRVALGVGLLGGAVAAGALFFSGGRTAVPAVTAVVTPDSATRPPPRSEDRPAAAVRPLIDTLPVASAGSATIPKASSRAAHTRASGKTSGASQPESRPTPLAMAFQVRILSFCWRDFAAANAPQPATPVHVELLSGPSGGVQNVRFHNLLEARYQQFRHCVVVRGTEARFTEPWSAPTEHIRTVLRW